MKHIYIFLSLWILTLVPAKAQLTFEDIKFWVGEGSNQAAFVVQWNDDKDENHALLWGYKWDGEATGEDMILAIAKADPRFYTIASFGNDYGTAIGGFGYDINQENLNIIINGENRVEPNSNGIIDVSGGYSFDGWTCQDTEDHWISGWMNGFWSYWIQSSASTQWEFSPVGVSTRYLENGSWDGWSFATGGFGTQTPPEGNKTIAALPAPDYTKGVFIVNEDWFGHDQSSVNYLNEKGEFLYHAYRKENPSKFLGVTTQYGTIYGGNFYFVSKQEPRLVVTDAKTLHSKTAIETFNNSGDGRAFVGVTPHKGYISTSNGIYIFNIDNLTEIGKIADTEGEVGNMLRTPKYVFAQKASELYIIDPNTDKIVKTIPGNSFYGLAQTIDGNVWVGNKANLLKIDPITLEEENISLPNGIEISSSTMAWNANTLCASATENALFWSTPGSFCGASNVIYKYIIDDESSLNTPFITIPDGFDLYGAGVRVHPKTNEVYVTAKKRGWEDNSLTNVFHRYSGETGEEIAHYNLEPYYWFPAIPVFPDVETPKINIENLTLSTSDLPHNINLLKTVTDADNNNAGIVVTVKSNSNSDLITARVEGFKLILEAQEGVYGSADITLSAISNGKLTEHTFNVTVSMPTAIPSNQNITLKVYPNPCHDYLRIEGQDITNGQITIYSTTGQVVFTQNFWSDNNQINTSNLKAGSYIVNIQTKEGVQSFKIVKY